MSAPTGLWPVQVAMRAKLKADAALSALITNVYDYVPETGAYPYVVIGEALETPSNAHDRFGRHTVPTLHVWDQYDGFKRVLAIGGRINELLDHQPLTLSGLSHVVTRFEFSQTLTDPEPPGDVRHLVLRYRVVTEQPPA